MASEYDGLLERVFHLRENGTEVRTELRAGLGTSTVTAPVMILVGCMMAKSLLKMPWDDPSEAIPAFLTLVGLPMTYNIAHGLAFGFISHPLLRLLTGRGREVSLLMLLLGALLILRYAFIKA